MLAIAPITIPAISPGCIPVFFLAIAAVVAEMVALVVKAADVVEETADVIVELAIHELVDTVGAKVTFTASV